MEKFATKPRVFRSIPGYAGASNHDTKGWVYLGRLGEAGPLTPVRFDTAAAHVVALFGKRGSGKSYTLGTLLEGLCTLGFDELIRSLDVGQALVSNTETDRAFIMDVRPRVSVHGGF
ncbi:MAG TPA: hypothetical protein VMV69_14950 [Pirellulales bacterium]|nr:hypothetical protein [Pirellulales bacterium]